VSLSYRRRLTRSLKSIAKRNSRREAIRLVLPVARQLAAHPSWLAAGGGDHALFFDMHDTIIGASVRLYDNYGRADFRRALVLLHETGRLDRRHVLLDIGANIGTHTVYALRSGLFRRVVAVEPAPANAALFRANMALNRTAERVSLHQAAAGTSPGTTRLHLDEANHGAHSLHRSELPRSVEVPVVRLDEILKAEAISLAEIGMIWIDTEGSEIECLGGMPEAAAAGIPLALEFNAAKYGQDRTAAFCRELATHYRSFAVITDEKPQARPIDKLRELSIPEWGFADILVF
jgi:FkbM family methyltransferase